MWKQYPLLKEQKINFSTIANPDSFEKYPLLAWNFYGHRYNAYQKTLPNIGFYLLKKLVEDKKDYFIVTSNVDDQFQRAGFDEEKIYEVHGRISKLQCTKCNHPVWNTGSEFNIHRLARANKLPDAIRLPVCPSCGALARPNIMMFNDYSYDDTITNMQEKAFNAFMRKYDKNGTKIAIIEIGAGTAIPTIRDIGEYIHNKIDTATLIRINPREAQVPKGAIGLETTGVESLTKLLQEYQRSANKARNNESVKNKWRYFGSNAGVFADELSPENEKRVNDILLALKLNKAAKAELKRREAKGKIKN